MVRTVAPLRDVAGVSVSDKAGAELNPHYFWLAREYGLTLSCGHRQVRVRCAFSGNPAPDKLDPPLPARVRCSDCPTVTSRGSGPKPKPVPVYDPVVGALAAAMCKADPDQQDTVLTWVQRHGRFIADDNQRARAYGAVALRGIDTYLPDTRNVHAPPVRAAVETWSTDPAQGNLVAVRRAVQRLYGSQRRDGDWCAHRGIIQAARVTSPAPHNVDAVLGCLTWDSQTRSDYYSTLWSLRGEHDNARDGELAAFVDGDGDGVRRHNAAAEDAIDAITEVLRDRMPTLGRQHMGLALALLAAYQDAAAT